MVQRTAVRFVKCDHRHTTSVSFITNQFGWPSLCDRRLESRLKLFGKPVAGRVAINTDGLVQPSRATHHSGFNLSYTIPATRTDIYKYSFVPRTKRD